ncbi:Cytochrome bo(3) ubiquinol oxidase subunit 3 [Buchnera aphidicola (Cinara kochiana kochiana)]|uniref:Cytochrome bo(3) ubiquinol oxidase subunit 3 n=1 Tax=Buchnera aphidicola (Cinara kochiana kochiana) TaxID=2518976 RepID=A0A451D5X0_9GAMM|nr:cytochrome c oxidase subunit 3 [Buchnera aphidicola]VFP81202.1 Cytochrome bo(3) ubiquinol oxidase subunit 3 [Buchnera aphidicola (Cinara kochiana kochiana)]
MNEKKKSISYSSLENKNIFGIWVYLMSDCIVFSVLFIVHIIMSRHGYNNFLRDNHLFSWFIIFSETLILLFSALSCSLVKYFLHMNSKKYTLMFLFFTLCLGSIFVYLEFFECLQMFNKGFYPISSGYLSSFFVLLGIHGLHIIFGLLWILILMIQILVFNLKSFVNTSIVCFCLFWHFIDIIWIILIACVYFK